MLLVFTSVVVSLNSLSIPFHPRNIFPVVSINPDLISQQPNFQVYCNCPKKKKSRAELKGRGAYNSLTLPLPPAPHPRSFLSLTCIHSLSFSLNFIENDGGMYLNFFTYLSTTSTALRFLNETIHQKWKYVLRQLANISKLPVTFDWWYH